MLFIRYIQIQLIINICKSYFKQEHIQVMYILNVRLIENDLPILLIKVKYQFNIYITKIYIYLNYNSHMLVAISKHNFQITFPKMLCMALLLPQLAFVFRSFLCARHIIFLCRQTYAPKISFLNENILCLNYVPLLRPYSSK